LFGGLHSTYLRALCTKGGAGREQQRHATGWDGCGIGPIGSIDQVVGGHFPAVFLSPVRSSTSTEWGADEDGENSHCWERRTDDSADNEYFSGVLAPVLHCHRPAAAAAGESTLTLHVVCPDGVGPGGTISVRGTPRPPQCRHAAGLIYGGWETGADA
jgi:hypothetical protein